MGQENVVSQILILTSSSLWSLLHSKRVKNSSLPWASCTVFNYLMFLITSCAAFTWALTVSCQRTKLWLCLHVFKQEKQNAKNLASNLYMQLWMSPYRSRSLALQMSSWHNWIYQLQVSVGTKESFPKSQKPSFKSWPQQWHLNAPFPTLWSRFLMYEVGTMSDTWTGCTVKMRQKSLKVFKATKANRFGSYILFSINKKSCLMIFLYFQKDM